jgi:hypothetical protein
VLSMPNSDEGAGPFRCSEAQRRHGLLLILAISAISVLLRAELSALSPKIPSVIRRASLGFR